MLVFAVLAGLSVFYPYTILVAGWGATAIVCAWWSRAVAREAKRATADAAAKDVRFFGYRFWYRYGGWAVFSGMFCLLLPTVAPRGTTWWQLMRPPPREPKNKRRTDPISHTVYLRDGSYFVLYDRTMRDPVPLIEAIASHVPLERA